MGGVDGTEIRKEVGGKLGNEGRNWRQGVMECWEGGEYNRSGGEERRKRSEGEMEEE